MRLFEITFPQMASAKTEALYYRTEGNVALGDGFLSLERGAKASFDTFYNCFSYSKYAKHTEIKTVRLDCKLTGKFVAELKLLLADGTETTLQKKNAEGDTYFDFEITALPDGGFLYVEFTALTDGTITGGGYFTDADIADVKIGIVICTYKRESYVHSNLNKLAAYFAGNGNLNDKFEVFVIDNGQTLDDSLPIGKVYKNKNLGGSGGFARGLYEVAKKGGFTHALLMDDDISFDCGIFEKLASLLATAKNIDELCVCGAMLNADKPYIQHEAGARFIKGRVAPLNGGLDMRKRKSLLSSEKEVSIDYGAWWFCCMPISFVAEYGYPMPFFIRGDDIEYGLRCCKEAVTLNGLAVWHERFDKKYNPVVEYYIKRNEAVISAIHDKKYGVCKEIKKLTSSVASQLAMQRYFVVDLLFKAYEDFLKGPDFLDTVDVGKLNAEIYSCAPKYLSGAELKAAGYDLEQKFYRRKKFVFKKFLQIITLNGFLMPSCFYNKKEKKYGRLIKLGEYICPSDFFRSKKTVLYDPEADRGYIAELKRSELFKTGLRLLRMRIKLFFSYGKVRKQFKKSSEIYSKEAWEKRF